MRKISQKDIAQSLNLSRVTVTKALKDHPGIALKTRELIKRKALEMGYIPDFIGRSLSSNKTRMIGIVLPKIAHSFFALSVEKFYEAAREKDYHIIPMISFEDQENELDNIQTLLSMRVDGMIVDAAGNSVENNHYELAKNAGCKILFYDRYPIGSRDGAVVTNDYEGAYLMTQLLIQKGYRKICHLAGNHSLNISVERQRGYEKAMEEHGLLKYILTVEMTTKSGYRAMLKLANEKIIPEAIFAVNDSVAHGIYQAANELGLNIPKDVAVAGFGDVEISRLLNPPMTSIKIPVEEMTKAAIGRIVEMIETNIDDGEMTIFPSEVIERQST